MKKACGGRTERNKEIYNYICKKFTEEMGVRYMQAWEERVKDREEGFAFFTLVYTISPQQSKLA